MTDTTTEAVERLAELAAKFHATKQPKIADGDNYKDAVFKMGFRSGYASAGATTNSNIQNEVTKMDFGDAIRAMKAGKRVARTGWNGKGMWVAYTPGSTFPKEHAKHGHAAKHRADEIATAGSEVVLLPHIDMRAADGSMVVGWLASQTDMLAEDWMEV